MGTTSRTWLLFVTIQLINAITAQEAVKRVPQGFVGMRGKKYYETDEPEQFYKRKPQFFVGVKGKKTIYDILENPDFYKRAHMGFVGMRGKKDALPIFYYPESYEYIPKRRGSLIGQIDYAAANGELNGKEPEYPLLNDLLTQYLQKMDRPNSIEKDVESNENVEDESSERITNEVEKRAANMHQFYGVRGKKSVQNKRPFDLSFRGKFIGVRGKKDLKNSGAQEIKFLLDQNGPWPKRKGQNMGFFGMRGKKWTDESTPDTEATK